MEAPHVVDRCGCSRAIGSNSRRPTATSEQRSLPCGQRTAGERPPRLRLRTVGGRSDRNPDPFRRANPAEVVDSLPLGERERCRTVSDLVHLGMGQRFRLRSDCDTSRFSFVAHVIAEALKAYRMSSPTTTPPGFSREPPRRGLVTSSHSLGGARTGVQSRSPQAMTNISDAPRVMGFARLPRCMAQNWHQVWRATRENARWLG